MQKGDIISVRGDSADLWISDYNVRVDTQGIVEETPAPQAKKVLVTLKELDGDRNVTVLVRRNRVKVVSSLNTSGR